RRAAVWQIVAVDRGNHDVVKVERANRVGDAGRFAGIDRPGTSVRHRAIRARARAAVAADHEGRGAAVPALADVRALRLLAPGVRDIERAMRLAQERPDKRDEFHSPYIVRLLNDATVEMIDIITEFRRYVLTAEKELNLGHWLFAQGTQEAEAAVQPWRGRL